MDGMIERIKEEMKKKGMNQKALADAMCIHSSSVSWWLSGKSKPTKEKLNRLAEVFGCSVEYLRDGVEKSVNTDNDIKRNGSGYFDPTAYKAIAGDRTYDGIEVRRGDVFYVENGRKPVGNEIAYNRPAVIVSNDANNKFSGMVEVVYMTTSEKTAQKGLPTHVPVLGKVPSTAMCEQVCSVSKARLMEFIRICTDEEMQGIDNALRVSLALDEQVPTSKAEELLKAELEKEKKAYDEIKAKMEKLATECNMLSERERQLRNEKIALEATLASAKKTFDKMQAENSKLKSAVAPAPDNSELERLKLKYELLEEQNERLLDRLIAG